MADHPLCSEHSRLAEVVGDLRTDVAGLASEVRGLRDGIGDLRADLRALRDSPPVVSHLVERALAPEVLRWIVALVLAVAIALGAVSVSELAPLILPVASGSQTPDDPPVMEAIP